MDQKFSEFAMPIQSVVSGVLKNSTTNYSGCKYKNFNGSLTVCSQYHWAIPLPTYSTDKI